MMIGGHPLADSKGLPSVLNGAMSPSAALSGMQTTLTQLPAGQRGAAYP